MSARLHEPATRTIVVMDEPPPPLCGPETWDGVKRSSWGRFCRMSRVLIRYMRQLRREARRAERCRDRLDFGAERRNPMDNHDSLAELIRTLYVGEVNLELAVAIVASVGPPVECHEPLRLEDLPQPK